MKILKGVLKKKKKKIISESDESEQ